MFLFLIDDAFEKEREKKNERIEEGKKRRFLYSLHDYNCALGFFVSREKESRKEEKKTYNVGRGLAIYIYICVINNSLIFLENNIFFLPVFFCRSETNDWPFLRRGRKVIGDLVYFKYE